MEDNDDGDGTGVEINMDVRETWFSNGVMGIWLRWIRMFPRRPLKSRTVDSGFLKL
jgi:hypothetical protein